MAVGHTENLLHIGFEIGCEQLLTAFHTVEVGQHLVHAVGGRQDNHVVLPRFAVGAKNQVEHLITTIAEKDAVGIHALDGRDALLQCALQRVGITVHTRLEWTFVGIKKDG